MFFVKSAQAASIAISSFLAGIAFSSLIFSRFSHHNLRNLSLIFWLQLLAAFYGYFVLSHYELIPDFIDSLMAAGYSEGMVEFLKAGIIWLFLLVPAFFMGGAFPLVNGLYMRRLEDSSKDTGTVYFWDTLGAIFGALLASYVLIPKLGLEIALLVPVVVNLLCCLMVCQKRTIKWMTLILLFALVIGEALRHNQVDFDIDLRSNTEKLSARFGRVLFQKESPFGMVTVGDNHKLYINYRDMCLGGSVDSSESHIGKTAADSIQNNAHVINIGLGCGMTAKQLIEHENVEKLDVVEINPVVLEATSKHLSRLNGDITNRDGVRMIIAEGYEYLRNSDKQYDAIVVDIEEPAIAHSLALYTREFFEVAQKRLSDGGVFALWSFPASFKFTRVIYNTLTQVFPYVIIHHDGVSNIYYASMTPKPNLETESAQAYMQQVKSVKLNEINTINRPNAEKYYNLNAVFSLPSEYRDEFAR